jgi:hypothetical protein
MILMKIFFIHVLTQHDFILKYFKLYEEIFLKNFISLLRYIWAISSHCYISCFMYNDLYTDLYIDMRMHLWRKD